MRRSRLVDNRVTTGLVASSMLPAGVALSFTAKANADGLQSRSH